MSDACCDASAESATALAAQHRGVLWAVLAINFGLFGVEVVAGLRAGSSALLGDSLDMLGDAIVYAASLYVVGRSLQAQARVGAGSAPLRPVRARAVLGKCLISLASWYPAVGFDSRRLHHLHQGLAECLAAAPLADEVDEVRRAPLRRMSSCLLVVIRGGEAVVAVGVGRVFHQAHVLASQVFGDGVEKCGDSQVEGRPLGLGLSPRLHPDQVRGSSPRIGQGGVVRTQRAEGARGNAATLRPVRERRSPSTGTVVEWASQSQLPSKTRSPPVRAAERTRRQEKTVPDRSSPSPLRDLLRRGMIPILALPAALAAPGADRVDVRALARTRVIAVFCRIGDQRR